MCRASFPRAKQEKDSRCSAGRAVRQAEEQPWCRSYVCVSADFGRPPDYAISDPNRPAVAEVASERCNRVI
jgi:hypothetical protein